MELSYSCADEICKFKIDRNTKTLFFASSKTNYRFVKHNWRMLFDKGKEMLQEKVTDGLNDEDFVICIDQQMRGLGYKKM